MNYKKLYSARFAKGYDALSERFDSLYSKNTANDLTKKQI